MKKSNETTPVPYSLTEAGKAAAEAYRSALERDTEPAPANPYASQHYGHDGFVDPASEPAAAPLGRSPAVLPSALGPVAITGPKPEAKHGVSVEKQARVKHTHDALRGDTCAQREKRANVCLAESHRFKDGVCVWCQQAEPAACPKCRTLLAELSRAVKDFGTLARPTLAQYASLSYNQIKAFDDALKPIGERVRKARAAYERHQRDAGHK
jgi:hypothetical protein